MLKDRRILVEIELDRLKKSAAQSYLSMVMSSNSVQSHSTASYFNIRGRITELEFDLKMIDELIAQGHE